VLPKGVILRSGDLQFTQKDLDAEIRKSPKDLWPQLKRNLFFVLESVFTRSLITWEAQSWAKNAEDAPKDNDSLISAYIDSLTKDVTVTDAELKSFFEVNQDMLGGVSFDQVKEQLRDYILEQKRSEIVQARISSLSDRYDVEIDKDWLSKQHSAAMDNPVDKARKSGRPTLVDFGADGCRPCEMMTPILDSLKKEYAGKVNIIFVHVRKEQVLAARYGIHSIPVQVFFDKDGKEVFRHVGFYPKDQIIAKLSEMGVK
jgi:thioredoxin 1